MKISYLFSALLTVSCLQFSLGAESYLPFKSAFSSPAAFVIHINSIDFVDAQGKKMPASERFDLNLCQSTAIDLTTALIAAKEAQFVPVAVDLNIKRNFAIQAEAKLETSKVVRLHTQTGMSTTSIGAITNISLASENRQTATLQDCYAPQSVLINRIINERGTSTPDDQTLIYTVPLSLKAHQNELKIIAKLPSVEFGGDKGRIPYIVVPHLPTFTTN
jgi:hypothetical protein